MRTGRRASPNPPPSFACSQPALRDINHPASTHFSDSAQKPEQSPHARKITVRTKSKGSRSRFYEKGCRVERDAPWERPPPHRTVRAVFPHTALRVGLVSSVSLPFAPRLRFTLIPMDAPPYGRAVSDAPPHSGLSPIAVFRHYCSRHLICIVPFTRRGPSHPRALPRAGPCGRRCRACGTFPSSYRSSAHLPATMASYDSSFRFRAPACAPFGFGLRRRFPSSSALRCILARPPKFLTELSRRVVLLCPARDLAVGFAVASGDLPSGLRPSAHAPARPKPIRTHGVGFTASELLAARNSSNETLRRRFICIKNLPERQDIHGFAHRHLLTYATLRP